MLDKILGAPVSFFDKTPKEVIMGRFNNDVGKLQYLVNKVFFVTHDTMIFVTTLFYIIKMNWMCSIGLIPFYIICRNTLLGSGKAFKEMVRCWESSHRGVRIN